MMTEKMDDKNIRVKSPDAAFVKNLFGSIASTYDQANDAMTFGMARLWRKNLVSWSSVRAGESVLDCATGTGDLALDFKRAVGKTGTVVGSDFCEEMLAVAPRKARMTGLEVKFELADATALHYSDAQFDVTSIAYGIRNVCNVSRALSELARVTKPGGRVMILETGEIENPVFRTAIRFYFEKLVPRIGGFISGRREAYEYLQSSSGAFPSGMAFCDLMMATDRYASVEVRSLMGGASYMYRGVVK